MALNEIFKVGKSISLPVPADTKSGDPVRVGVLNGVAIVDEGSGFNKEGYTSVDMFGGNHNSSKLFSHIYIFLHFTNGKLTSISN